MSWKVYLLSSALVSGAFFAKGQNAVGIGIVNPNKNAVLELVSPGNNQGLLVPKLTTAQRTATTFTTALTSKENGLLVFDSEENKFYYWQATQWQPVRAGTDLSVGTGVTITGNSISTIPQDLQLTGSTLKITNNPSATSINLSAFTGTNTDDQTLTFDNATGQLSISRLSGGTQNVALAGVAPGGTASGDFSGTYPSPTIAATSGNNIVTAINNAATTNLINANRLNSSVVLDTESPATGNISGTYATGFTLVNNAVTTAKIAPGTNGQILTTTGGVAAWATGTSPTGTAGGDLTGTYPNPTIATDAITSAKILDATILAADLATSAVTTVKIAPGTNGQVLTTAAGVTAWANAPAPTGTAGGDLSGTYPNPTIAASAITSAKINDGAIVNADINGSAAIDVSKLAPGTSGQVLTTSGSLVPQWSAPGGTTLIQSTGTRNLFAGLPIGTASTGTDNAFYGTSAGSANTSGNYNVIVGTQAGINKTVGDLNTLVGWLAGRATASTATFNGNTFIGAQSGLNTTGGPNTFIGEKAGMTNTTGTQNLFAGNSSGDTNTTGAQNTILGYGADVSTSGLSNTTAVGYSASVTTSNTMVFGNTNVVGWGFGVSPNTATAIHVGTGATNGNGASLTLAGAWTNASDSTKKDHIKTLQYGLSDILKLKPVSYKWKGTGQQDFGFLAQEVKKILPEIVVGEEGQMSISYGQITAVLTKAVQEQQKEIQELKQKLSASEQKINTLNASIQNLKSESEAINNFKSELEEIKKMLGVEANAKAKK